MKVKFIQSHEGMAQPNFTIFKQYEVINTDNEGDYWVNDDNGSKTVLLKTEVDVIEEDNLILKDIPKPPRKDEHYNNDNGSLYLFAQHHDLNAWEFDILKRVVRCRKKGQFKEDLEKTKRVIDLYLKEFEA